MSLAASFVILGWLAAQSGVVRVEADRDGTLIEHPSGAFANGSGPALFVGRTNQPSGSVRRGLVHFDLAGLVPAGAVILDARLVLHVSSLHVPTTIRAHRLLHDWGEGASSSSGGQGAPAQPGDATWIHRFYDTELWNTPGGLSAASRSSAQGLAKSPDALVLSGAELRRNVETWLAAPAQNFGWLLIGDELASQTVTSLVSRESPAPKLRPVLEFTWRMSQSRR